MLFIEEYQYSTIPCESIDLFIVNVPDIHRVIYNNWSKFTSYKISQQHLIQEIYLILRVEWTKIYKVIITTKCWGKVTTPYIICLKCGLVFYIMSVFWLLTTHNFTESVIKKNEKLSLETCIEFDNVIVFLKTRIASKRSLIFLHWPNCIYLSVMCK